MLDSSVIGDYIVSTDFLNKEIPAGVPLQVIGIETDPDPSEEKWNGLPDEIRNSGNPFYIVEFPNIVKEEMAIGFLEMKNCKPFKYEEDTSEEDIREKEKDSFWSNEDFF
tara:strand:- start:5602 stop:5931 length:330 start_codon:yes stop_codon:yes gene_type:complete